MIGRLAGKVAVITGTASGQGRAAALLFAAAGATVMGCDVQAGAAQETVELVRAAGGDMDSRHPLDLKNEDGVRRWFADIQHRHGAIDILYNNAGAAIFGPFEQVTSTDWRTVHGNELDQVFFVTQAAWPLLRKRGGSVVMVASVAGMRGSMTNHRAAHSSAKGAIVALTRQLAAEGAEHRIRVNSISPGIIATPATAANVLAEDHSMRQIADAVPLGRLGTPDDVARTALFLASDDAAYITGANIVVDGGWSTVLPGGPFARRSSSPQ